ncbi:unnamed protein product [Peronospora farinosa]|uniref:Uncharacterized protein n=1 Tax=Peronospora farinosa TaxID=134698 RepID=A0AAV0TNK8_9STRA|nr:unnamed protein product [Peronospora farinosa]CAI5723637.1 unnamed protein product [Peronospora farinosa]
MTLQIQSQDIPIANSSQRMALSADKDKNWRVSYLRALNIVTPDLSRRRRVSSGEGTRRTASQQTSNGRGETMTSRRRTATVTDETMRRPLSGNSRRGRSDISTSTSSSVRQSSSRSGSSSRSKRGASPSDGRMSTYVFGLRSHLFRPRRLAPRSDVELVAHVSAPIEIPTGVTGTSPTAIPSRAEKLLERDLESCRRRSSTNAKNWTGSMVQLLSWEEPSMILKNGGRPLEIEKRNSSCTGNDTKTGCGLPQNGSRSRWSTCSNGIVEVCEDTENEDVDEMTNSEDDDDDIFKMEFDGDPNGRNNLFKNKQPSKHRRRADLKQRRRGGFDELDNGVEDNVVTPLSVSFVPPHQMVEHGCFSLGLRDKLKRKPGVV